jgi:membrane protein YdbS with pleckstrin-like domain
MPTPSFPRPGDRPTMLPEESVVLTNQPYAPPYDAYPDYEIRNVNFEPRWLRRRPPRFFASPDQILYSLLASKEVVVYGQSPSFSAFLIEQVAPLLLLLLVGGITLNAVAFGSSLLIYGIIFVVVGLAWLLLSAKWIFRDRYIRYVLTTMRVMRVRGFIKRENAWIPLAKVTDVRYNSGLIGRMFGFAEIRIDSANEESGLKYMRNLADPETFYEKLLLLVEMRQGNITLEPPTGSGGSTPSGPTSSGGPAFGSDTSPGGDDVND